MADVTSNEQIEQALELARTAPEEVVADHIQFDFSHQLILIYLSNGRRLVLPLEDIQKLGEATHDQLEDYDLLGNGYAVEWPQLNIAFRIEGLIEGLYGSEAWMQQLHRNGAARCGTTALSQVRTKSAKPRKRKITAA